MKAYGGQLLRQRKYFKCIRLTRGHREETGRTTRFAIPVTRGAVLALIPLLSVLLTQSLAVVL